MKPILIYELSFVLSFFSKQYAIETINLKHFDFFLGESEKDEQLISLFSLKDSETPDVLSSDDKKVLPWNDISIHEYNFCLSRLSKNMSYKEKIYTIIMLFELCHSNGSFYMDRLDFVKKTADTLGINPSTLSLLEKLAVTPKTDINWKDDEKNIVIIKKADIIESPNTFIDSANSNMYAPVFIFVYIYEEKLFLLKVLDKKAKINGMPIESDKIYPLNEGDVLSSFGKLMSFNELFRLYYSYSTFYPLYIEPTDATPLIHFNPKNNLLDVKGCSVPEDGVAFYMQVLNWIDNYLLTKPQEITMNVHLDYFNTTSSKFIFEMLKKLERYKTEKTKLVVNWYFINGDEDLEEAGQVYSDVINIPFSLIPMEH